MLSYLVREHKCELFHALFYSQLSIAHVYHTMSVHSITFLVYQPFQLEGVMAVSVGVKTWSSEKIVPVPPHITQTHVDCTPTQLDREPATPLLTPTPADSNPIPVDTTPSPPQSTQTRAFSKATRCPKHDDCHIEPKLHA